MRITNGLPHGMFRRIRDGGQGGGHRGGRWSHAAVNAAYILGIARLFGAVTPLNLRLLGLWRGVPREALARVAVGAAGALLLNRAHGLVLHDAPAATLRRHAILSLACWTGAILCGRFITFAD